LVATTNALVAFVVDRCGGEGKPTIAAKRASIVATHSNSIPPVTEAIPIENSKFLSFGSV